MVSYFLDTYALIEIIKGNKNYARFVNKNLATSIFHLFELYYVLLRDYDEIIARKYFFKFREMALDVKDKNIFFAAKFKLLYKKDRLSYADTLGYAIAEDNNMRFLTGDGGFKGKENVEFVK